MFKNHISNLINKYQISEVEVKGNCQILSSIVKLRYVEYVLRLIKVGIRE